MSKITKYETEFLTMMQTLNEQMTELTESGLMSEEALRKMGVTQAKQWGDVKNLLASMFKSEYYQKRTGGENSLATKRITEAEKRKRALLNPLQYHTCARCDRIFTSKSNLARHKEKTVVCQVIRLGKKGAIEEGNHRTMKINQYIDQHFNDVSDSEDEEEVEEIRVMEDQEESDEDMELVD